MKLTVKVKLLSTPEQQAALLRTMETFNDACNYLSGIAWKEKTFGQVGLHHRCYYDVRKAYGLSSQLTVRAIGKVAESYRAEKHTRHTFRKHAALVYDERILSFKGSDTVSILSCDGRLAIPIVYGAHARLDRPRGQADLLFVRKKLFLSLCIEHPEGALYEPQGTLGVDLGIANIATTSDGAFFSGGQIDEVRERTTKLKRALQTRRTKSAKRHLQKLSGREARFKRHTNHVISKQIVTNAKDTGRRISLEDLKGMRVRITVRKGERERFGTWAFDQLRQFIEYKAQLAGVPVVAVDPRNTSRTCSACGFVSRSNRKSQRVFSCLSCGFTAHADVNASIVIASRANVNWPIAVHAPALSPPAPGTAMPRQLLAAG